MKITLPLYLSFFSTLKLCSMISVNDTFRSQIIDPEFMNNVSVKDKSYTFETDLKKAIETPEESTIHTVVINENILPTTLHKEGFSANNHQSNALKNMFHIIKIRPEHLKNQYLNQLSERYPYSNERYPYSNVSPYHRKVKGYPQTVNYKPEKRGLYFDPFYPMFYHHNNFNDFTRGIYHPYFHKNYRLRDSDERFMNKKQFMDKFLFGNRDYYPEKKFIPSYSEEKIFSSSTNPPISFLISPAYGKIRPYTKLSDLREKGSGVNSVLLDISKGKSELKQEIVNKAFNEVENTEVLLTDVTSDLPKEFTVRNNRTLDNSIKNLFASKLEYSRDLGGPEILNSHRSEMSPFSMFNEEEPSDNFSNRSKRERFESTNIEDFKRDNLNLLSSNKVYYERIPFNLNNSWFVYVNCSRDKCQFSNSTNETELRNEGWILHNCTNYGCTEMYPKTQSIQKFIGLMLLVFSLCILKIIAFVLLFYYCRRIKLSKNESEEQKRLNPEEGNSYLPSGEENRRYKDIDRGTASKNHPEYTEDVQLNFTQQRNESKISPNRSRDINYLPNEVENLHSKVWIPPIQRVSPCLVAPLHSEGGDILIPKKCMEKKSPGVNGENLLKCKRRTRSNIPRLEKLVKCNSRRDIVPAIETSGNSSLKATEQPVMSNIAGDGEFLLMNLDDEICNNIYCPGNIEKTPNWEALLEKECKSFISLDLSEDGNSKK